MGVPAVIWKGSNSAYCIPQSFEARVINPSASSNQMVFGPSSGNRITLNVAIPSANRTYTIPDTAANSSFVMTDASQTIDGFKTFVRNVSIQASTLIFRSAATTVSLTTATPTSTRLFTLPDQPSSDILVADGTQTVTGTYTFNNTILGSISGNAGTVTNGAYVNAANTFTLAQTITATSNQLVLHSGVNQVIINSGTSAAARTYTIPDTGTTDTFAMLGGTQSFTGAKTFSSAVTISAASNQLVLSSGVNQLTLNSSTSAAARTYAFPDVGTSGTVAMLEGSQTFTGLKTFSSGLAISGGSAANNTIWVASNVLNIRGGTSGTDIYNTSGNVVVDITDGGIVTLGPTTNTTAVNLRVNGRLRVGDIAASNAASQIYFETTGTAQAYLTSQTGLIFETDRAGTLKESGSVTAAGAWAWGPSSGLTTTHVIRNAWNGGTGGVLQLNNTNTSAAIQLTFASGGTDRWALLSDSTGANFDIYSIVGGATVGKTTSAGAWTWGASGFSGFHTVNGGMRLPSSGATASTLNFYAESSISTTYTWNSSGPTSSAVTVYITRIGNVVTLTQYAGADTASSASSSTLATSNTVLPSWARPTVTTVPRNIIYVVANAATDPSPGSVQITTAGNIEIRRRSDSSVAWGGANNGTGGFTISYYV